MSQTMLANICAAVATALVFAAEHFGVVSVDQGNILLGIIGTFVATSGTLKVTAGAKVLGGPNPTTAGGATTTSTAPEPVATTPNHA